MARGLTAKNAVASQASLERAEGLGLSIIGEDAWSDDQIKLAQSYALQLDEVRKIRDPEEQKVALHRAMSRFIRDVPETDRQIAVSDSFFNEVYGVQNLPREEFERVGAVVNGNPENLPYWGGRLVDNSGIWLGEKQTAIEGAVQGFVKEHPTAGVALQVVATGYDVLGGPVKWAGNKALELFKGKVTSWVEGGYTEAGWGTSDATNGSKGVVLGAGIVLGGGLKKLLGGRPSWRASELDVGARIEGQRYRAQVSFKDGAEVPYGTKGSVSEAGAAERSINVEPPGPISTR